MHTHYVSQNLSPKHSEFIICSYMQIIDEILHHSINDDLSRSKTIQIALLLKKLPHDDTKILRKTPIKRSPWLLYSENKQQFLEALRQKQSRHESFIAFSANLFDVVESNIILAVTKSWDLQVRLGTTLLKTRTIISGFNVCYGICNGVYVEGWLLWLWN